ncbi:glucose-methanol-choline oxidoreductase [Burkholderia sp. SRS-W-2-2016]|uniref:alpha/beta fold hydrolase n=1 Tax=Burkholderia sp. SRS-W-2-2016 TaxID=1926878 RepID=UPI00094B290C|nr:alpha/beta fold hydrolase [Burkholderia sp. SRS-W-2-2016]OLL28879.1 glucose-methanol-choline oxidoreductase [Burkholderia sp. SRS-W-2-2016]
MNRLSSAPTALQSHYEVVVIGSGYGGAIAASRMARAGRSVCVLERGREFIAGEYPRTPVHGVENIQYNTAAAQIGSRLALIEVHVNEDVNAVVGCGLGGTSLINANVALRADPRLWNDPRWPAALRADQRGRDNGYALAWQMLSPAPVPADFPPLPKLQALEKSAQALGMADRFSRPPITVTFNTGPNAAGVEQHACVGCGDCNSGCNYDAKNSTHMNYLPDAVAHGAQIFTGAAVHSVLRDPATQQWKVNFQLVKLGRESFGAPDLFVLADIVIVAAGSIGSTALLLRSRDAGLNVSDMLGQHFTGNGDVLAFAYNTRDTINGVGWGEHDAGEIEPVGPTITGLIDNRASAADVKDGYVIEEGSLAGPVGEALVAMLGAVAPLEGIDPAGTPPLHERLAYDARTIDSVIRGPYHGALHHTQSYLVMAHDDERGRISIDKRGRARIAWPNAGSQPVFQTIEDVLIKATVPLGGKYLRNPISNEILGRRTVTVHPLGGCGMGEDAQHGVVDHTGCVFSGAAGNAVHDGLYVMDGAVMPMSLGVNPLLTISALAERNCALLAAKHGWSIDYAAQGTAAPPPAQKIGLRFTETMVGTYTPAVVGDAASSPIEFTLTVESDDLADMLSNPDHLARTAGTLTCPALSAQPLTITDGTFNLFVVDASDVDERNMTYHMTLNASEGKTYYLTGQKIITRTSPINLWEQTNTLYAQIRASSDETAPVVGTATLIITPANFLKQQRTLEVTHAPDLKTRLEWTLKFGKFFAGVLFSEYGGVAAPLQFYDPTFAPRAKRTLRAPPPQITFFTTPDGTTLKLTRYHDAASGKPTKPVLLIHGSGVSSRIFSTDLIATNLVEYLCASDYDVWLVDLRVSIELPSVLVPTDVDKVAREDIPAAVAKIRDLTGAPQIQVLGHCMGGLALSMSLLYGLAGVRSAVISQVAAHPVPGKLQRVKAGLHIPDLMQHLRVRDLTAYTQHDSWPANLFDEALRLYPLDHDEGCGSPICHRATFLYGLLYEHEQLNETLHANLQELFGIHDMAVFQHLAAMVRAGHVVDARGDNVYLAGANGMKGLEGMRLPIGFIHGERNETYLPESTELTFDMLRNRFPEQPYERHLIPGYGHIDCIFGKNAAVDVYPVIVRYLDEH